MSVSLSSARGQLRLPTPGMGCRAPWCGGALWGQGSLDVAADVRHSVAVAVGTVGLSPQGQCPAVSVKTGRHGVCWLLRACSARELGGPGPRAVPAMRRSLGESAGGGMGPRELPARAEAQSRHARAAEGTIVVSGRSGLGRHVDVPERNGAAGGLVAKQQGRRVCVHL